VTGYNLPNCYFQILEGNEEAAEIFNANIKARAIQQEFYRRRVGPKIESND
jgi:hypothetical protein